MTLSFRGFAAWWFVILGTHLVAFVCAKFYWMFGTTLLRYSLDSYDVGMSREHFHTLQMVLANGRLLLLMVVGSLCKRCLVIYPWSQSIVKRRGPRFAMENSVGAIKYRKETST
ncbi:hypothetical protein GQ600_6469 [Phytophthora cactorum]|nr:hypothetical protein GQ600_6469 [Phytophthora cactorum]